MNGTIDLQAESIYRGSLILVNREYGYRERAEDLAVQLSADACAGERARRADAAQGGASP